MMLNHFLYGRGNVRNIDFKRFINDNPSAQRLRNENLNSFMEATEMLAENGTTIKLGMINCVATCVSPESQFEGMTDDWWFTVGTAEGWLNAEVTRSGNRYTAHVYYNLWDFYDWEPGSDLVGGLVTDGEMAMLHAAGVAKEYEIRGLYEMRLTWSVGQRVNSGAVFTDW